MIAFVPSLGWEEMFLLLLIGLLLYGRNLPEAGRNLGRVVAQLKRSFHDFKDQLDREGEIRDVKKAFEDTAREVRNVAKVPRAFADPGAALRELSRDALTSDPETRPAEPPVPEDAAPRAGDGHHRAAEPAPNRNGASDTPTGVESDAR